jgi:hypothetical protein
MTDAIHGRHQAHDDALAGAHEHAHPPRRAVAPMRASLLEASAVARLLGVSSAIAALWGGVYWALH